MCGYRLPRVRLPLPLGLCVVLLVAACGGPSRNWYESHGVEAFTAISGSADSELLGVFGGSDVLISVDQGQTWRTVEGLGRAHGEALARIWSSGDRPGVIVAVGVKAIVDGLIVSSTDGGMTWTSQVLHTSEPRQLRGACATSQDRLFVAGFYGVMPQPFFGASSDGGETWATTDLAGAGVATDVACSPNGEVLGLTVSGDDSVLYRYDAGDWQRAATIPGSANGLWMDDRAAYLQTARGVLASEDGGATLRSVHSITGLSRSIAGTANAVYFVDASSAYALTRSTGEWRELRPAGAAAIAPGDSLAGVWASPTDDVFLATRAGWLFAWR
jgi:hypothetical protein